MHGAQRLPALTAGEVRRALVRLPGWKAIKHGRRLLGDFRLRREADAAAFVVAAVVLGFEDGLFPEVEAISRAVRLVVSEREPWVVTPRVLAFAGRLSDLAGSPGASTLGPATAMLGRLVEELTRWAAPGAVAVAAKAERSEPIAGMLSLLATFEATARAFLPWIEKARAALAPLLPSEAEIERRAEADTLTRPMQLDRDARLLAARLDPLLALLRTAQMSDGTQLEEASDARSRSLLDSTEDLTPHLRPNLKPDPSEP